MAFPSAKDAQPITLTPEQPTLLVPGQPLPPHLKGFMLGYPMGHLVSSRNDASTEALLDYCYGLATGKVPWAKHLRYLGSSRSESVRIDDNRNVYAGMFLDAASRNGAQVLVQLDRDEIVPPDGVAQLVVTCTPQIPIVCGVYFQRSPSDPYPHVYRPAHQAPNRWGEYSHHNHKLTLEVLRWLDEIGVPPSHFAQDASTAVRFAQKDGTPLPEEVRLLFGGWGATGFTAIHITALQKMKDAGAPFYPWFREDGGDKGDVLFFHKARQLGIPIAVDLSVYAGHLAEVPIGLPHFYRQYHDLLTITDAHTAGEPINSVCAVIPTLDPVMAGKMLGEIKATAGVSVTGVIVADYEKRGGTRTLNDGIAAAESVNADAILLLDDDLFDFPQGWLRQLCDVLQEPNVAAVGPSIACRGPQGKPLTETQVNPNDMPFLVGACMLYKRSAFKDAGPLDEGCRHYASDSDSSRMLRKLGWRLKWVPEVKIGHAIAGSGFFPEQWNKDHDYYARKWGLPRQMVASVAPDQPPPQDSSVGLLAPTIAPGAAAPSDDAPVVAGGGHPLSEEVLLTGAEVSE